MQRYASEPPTGRTPIVWGDYVLLSRIGRGGMAHVYLARPRNGGSNLAIKRMKPTYLGRPQFARMFAAEAEIARSIRHENVCRVYDFGAHDGEVFIAMEYLAGPTVKDLSVAAARSGRRVSARLASSLCMQACDGLGAIHAARSADGRLTGVVHRDVTPPNLLVTWNGVLKILDFGVAKAAWSQDRTREGVFKGKWPYMSPEQIQGKPLDARSDLFSLGVVLWELLTSRSLFFHPNKFRTFEAILGAPIPPLSAYRPDIPATLCSVVDRALSRDRDLRYQSAAHFRAALAAANGGPREPLSRSHVGRALRASLLPESAPPSWPLSSAPRRRDRAASRLPLPPPTLITQDGDTATGL